MTKGISKKTIYGIAIGTLTLLMGGIWYANTSNNTLKQSKNEDHIYVSKLFSSPVQSVVNTEAIMIKPYNDNNVKEIKSFYDYKGKETEQEKSLLNYDTTYIQNNGIAYGGINNTFDVVSTLDGKITSIKDDKLLGKIITIEHSQNIITTYQSLSEVTVKEGDEISQGTVIGKAGNSNLDKNLGKHILFKISINNSYVNPNSCYNKPLSQLKSNWLFFKTKN